MAFPLGNLPPELRLCVYDELQDDRQDILSLSLVSRGIYAGVRRYLYRTVELDLGNQVGSMFLLTRTLFEHRELTDSIRTIRLTIDRYQGNEGQADLGWVNLRNHIQSHCSEDMEDTEAMTAQDELEAGWSLQLLTPQLRGAVHVPSIRNRRDAAALAGIILTLARNVRALEVRNVFIDCWPRNDATTRLVPHFLFPIPVDPHDILVPEDVHTVPANIRKLTLLPSMTQGLRNIRSLHVGQTELCMLNLPLDNLRDLGISICHLTGGQSDWEDRRWGYMKHVKRQYPNLESLTIRGHWSCQCVSGASSDYAEIELSRWIKHLGSTGLKAFQYILEPCMHEAPGAMTFGTLWFMSHLRDELLQANVHESLERIHLDATRDMPTGQAGVMSLVRTGPLNFTWFPRLKELSLPQYVVDGFYYPCLSHGPVFDASRVFPSSLESLVIRAPNQKVLQWMESIVDNISAFPNLRQLTLLCQHDPDLPATWFTNSFPEIKALTSVGIAVDIVQHTENWAMFGSPQPGLWEGDWSDEDWRTTVFSEDY